VVHPEQPDVNQIALVTLHGPADTQASRGATASPCPLVGSPSTVAVSIRTRTAKVRNRICPTRM
jgi:hypothetical protein